MLNILSMGEIPVHPLYGGDQKQSIESAKSTLSIPIAPEKRPTG